MQVQGGRGFGSMLGFGVERALRGAALPALLGLRWAGQRGAERPDEVPAPPRSLSTAAKIAGDELFFAGELLLRGFIATRDRARISYEIGDALALYRSRGWLEDAAAFHGEPPPLERPDQHIAVFRGLYYRRLSFESGYAPHPGEPGRERWLGYAANRTAHAWVLRHQGPPRPWLVCVPGYRMGRAPLDLVAFDAARLHRGLGLNVAIPVLPLHGPRRIGALSGDGFLSGEFLDTVHLLAQAAWDVRRLVGWIRAQDAPAIGMQGLSLGGYTTALIAGLEADLDCVIAGIPAADFVRISRWNAPALLVRLAERFGWSFERVEELLRVVSPLSLAPKVPHARRFVFAGTADRLAPPEHARDLWRHWERPRVAWYHGGHLSFRFERSVSAFVHDALRSCGMLPGA